MTAALSPDHMLAPWAGQALLDNPAIREGSGALAGALLDHKTFSNLTVQWHAPDGVLESQLSGAPVNDRDGQFSGYRGFGTVLIAALWTRLFPALAARDGLLNEG